MGANYWTSKVLPKIKKVFELNGPKKLAAAEAAKAFDEAKEQYTTEFEEKKNELQPKVVEILEASSAEIKRLVKERKDAADLKKHSADVQKFLDELVKIEFPGSKLVSEASSKLGPAYVSGPVFFVFEKVSTFIVIEEESAPPATEVTATTAEEKPSATEDIKEKEIVIAEEIVADKTEAPVQPAAPATATTEVAKVAEAPAAPAAAAPAPAAAPSPAAASAPSPAAASAPAPAAPAPAAAAPSPAAPAPAAAAPSPAAPAPAAAPKA